MKNDKSYLEKIVLEILVPPSFPGEYHSALIKVSDQCAVKKAIMSPPKFEIKTTVR